MDTHSSTYDPYNQGTYGCCQHCDDEGKLTWNKWLGFRTCYDCAGR